MKISKAKLLKSRNVTQSDIKKAKAASEAAFKRLGGKHPRARSLHATYASLKSIVAKRKNPTKSVKPKRIVMPPIHSKLFKLKNKNVNVLVINGEYVIYDDKKLTTVLERQLDTQIADYIGFERLEHVTTLK